MADPTRVAAGLKAAIHNPNVSEGAKEHAAERLHEMGKDTPTTEQRDTRRSENEVAPTSTTHGKSRVLGGYKATLSNESTSEEAKQHAREVLEAAGYHFDKPENSTDEEHQRRIIGGYKAALNNPRVSEGAKEHARKYLQEHASEAS